MGRYHFNKILKEKGLWLDDITKALCIKDDPIHHMDRAQRAMAVGLKGW